MDVNKHERLSIFTSRHKPKGKVMELKYIHVQQLIDIRGDRMIFRFTTTCEIHANMFGLLVYGI
jgi:hypothetical protein